MGETVNSTKISNITLRQILLVVIYEAEFQIEEPSA